MASLVAQRLKRLPAMQETWVRSLGQEDPPTYLSHVVIGAVREAQNMVFCSPSKIRILLLRKKCKKRDTG